MVVLLASTNLPHPSLSPCGADVCSILTDPKATHTWKHHLGPCFSCARVSVWAACRNLSCVYLNVTVLCVYECIFMCVCSMVIEGVRGMLLCTDRETHLSVFFLFCMQPYLCVFVCLFVYTPAPGQEFPDEPCLWQVEFFGKLDKHRTIITNFLLAPSFALP